MCDRDDHDDDGGGLVALMRAGDVRALDELARTFGERLHRVARRSCRCADDVEDAVQQALLEASGSLASFRGDGEPLAWLSRLVVYSCYRLNRGRKNDPALHVRDVNLTTDAADPEEGASRLRLGERLSVALMGLARADRLALLMSVEGYTGQEIANELGLTADAVRSRLKRARQQLREQLDDTDPRDDGTSSHADLHRRRLP